MRRDKNLLMKDNTKINSISCRMFCVTVLKDIAEQPHPT